MSGTNGTAGDFIKSSRSVEDRRPLRLDFAGFLPERGNWDCGETFPAVIPRDGATFSG